MLKTPLKWRGIDLPAALIRIEQVFGNETHGWNVSAVIYASQEAFDAKEPAIEPMNLMVPYVAGKDPFALGYAELQKKYPEAVVTK